MLKLIREKSKYNDSLETFEESLKKMTKPFFDRHIT